MISRKGRGMSVRRLLIADDEETFLLSTADWLQREGFKVDCARDSASAARLLHDKVYDLLILDVNMPGNSQLEFVHLLGTTGASVPIILVTGYPSVGTAVAAVGLSVLAYLIKPFDLQTLLDHVRAAMTRSSLLTTVHQALVRLRNWETDLVAVEEALKATPAVNTTSAKETFVLLSIQNVVGVLNELKRLIDTQALSQRENDAYELLGCPPPMQTMEILRHTVDVLEKTKGSFKSKELRDLRLHVETFLPRPVGGKTTSN